MDNVYENCPVLENDRWLLRLIEEKDTEDLLKVYSDKNSLPFFNSDNCDGDNFYYPTIERMKEAMDFWFYSYREKWFVRFAIVDKNLGKAIGTIEAFHRPSNGDFDEVGVIRLDLASRYENSADIKSIMSVILPSAYDLFDCKEIISKCPIYAVERSEAFGELGFRKTDTRLVGNDGTSYGGYWIRPVS